LIALDHFWSKISQNKNKRGFLKRRKKERKKENKQILIKGTLKVKFFFPLVEQVLLHVVFQFSFPISKHSSQTNFAPRGDFDRQMSWIHSIYLFLKKKRQEKVKVKI